MPVPPAESITRLLEHWRSGDLSARDQLVTLLYDELRVLARRQLRSERPGQTLQTADLVNELYLKLLGAEEPAFNGRAHFLGVAAHVMRRILVDHARRRNAAKRAAGQRVEVTDIDALPVLAHGPPAVDVLALDTALLSLQQVDPRAAQLVELRHFGGLTWDECAETLGISPATAKRDWTIARAFLLKELRGVSPEP
jgi:RNA polymerase sigma factor (TIGR02999 family)